MFKLYSDKGYVLSRSFPAVFGDWGEANITYITLKPDKIHTYQPHNRSVCVFLIIF